MVTLEVDGVVKRYGDITAVNRVSFTARPGRILGLLGPNGAGKTSTLRMITHIIPPDAGIITVNQRSVGPWSQRLMGYLPEERGLYKHLHVGEQLIYLGRLKGLNYADAKQAAQQWLDRLGALDWFNRKTNDLSKGMQQKVQFIATLLHAPDLLIFDEPFSGLDPINADLLRDIILDLKSQGHTILFASHRMEQVERLCDDICLMANGQLVLSGGLRQIKHSFGQNTVIVEFDGSPSFIQQLVSTQKVRVVEQGPHYAELHLLGGTTGRTVLRAAFHQVEITRFELVEPSMNEIFTRSVNNGLQAPALPAQV